MGEEPQAWLLMGEATMVEGGSRFWYELYGGTCLKTVTVADTTAVEEFSPMMTWPLLISRLLSARILKQLFAWYAILVFPTYSTMDDRRASQVAWLDERKWISLRVGAPKVLIEQIEGDTSRLEEIPRVGC